MEVIWSSIGLAEEEKVLQQTAEGEPVSSVPVPEQAELPPGTVDVAPDPAALKAEIERLQKIQKEAEEKAIYWRKQKAEARADFFKSRGEPAPPPAAPPQDLGIGPEPKQEEFEDYQKYLDAKISFEVTKAKTTWDRDQARRRADEMHQQKMASLQAKIGEGFQKYQDFEETALAPEVPITPMIMDILSDSERPAEIAYYLGKHRSEAIQISRMHPLAAVRAITKIEMGLTGAGNNPAMNPPITAAPPPIKPVGSTHTVEPDLEKLSQKEFEAIMQKRTGRRF